jgi:hypothetical protein
VEKNFHLGGDVMSVRKAFYVVLITIAMSATVLLADVPTTLNDFFLPGSQPGQSGNIEHPDKCDNCHGGYDSAV